MRGFLQSNLHYIGETDSCTTLEPTLGSKGAWMLGMAYKYSEIFAPLKRCSPKACLEVFEKGNNLEPPQMADLTDWQTENCLWSI